MENKNTCWQDTDYVLGRIGKDVEAARKKYREYVREGSTKGGGQA